MGAIQRTFWVEHPKDVLGHGVYLYSESVSDRAGCVVVWLAWSAVEK